MTTSAFPTTGSVTAIVTALQAKTNHKPSVAQAITPVRLTSSNATRAGASAERTCATAIATVPTTATRTSDTTAWTEPARPMSSSASQGCAAATTQSASGPARSAMASQAA